jgi:hypothetical protein
MSCHGSRKTAGVDLQSATGDLRALLNINACEVPAYKIVDATGGEAALTKSWLWQKLTAPADGSTELVPQAAWGTAANCGQMAGGFGSRMPWQSTTPLAQDKLDAVKAWICAGAPGK